jgi:hypothetical protein
MAMARVSMEVPAELVGPVRETVLLLYQATAESLQLSLRAHSEGRGSLEEVAEHRARLAQLDELAGSLGWHAEARSGEPRPGGPAPPSAARQLSAPAELLHDAFYGALIDAGERLAVTASSAWRGELPLERVQEAAAEVLALHRLLGLLESLSARPNATGMASDTQTSHTKTTTDHGEIRRWVEEHGGRPARVRGSGDGGDPGMLRIDFPGGTGEEQLEPISWDEWFQKFDEAGLAFLYQEQRASGEDSTFFKLVQRDSD